MKRHLFSAIVVLFMLPFTAKAQITVNSADLPVIGNMVVFAVDTITPVSPGNAGPNQVWDLSALIPSRSDTILYIPVQGVPNYQNYPQANIVCDYSRVTESTASENFYNYFFNENSENAVAFKGAEWTEVFPEGFTLHMHWHYNTTKTYVPLPLYYTLHLEQEVDYTVYQGVWYGGMMVDSARNDIHENIIIDVDAYGTMITPYDVFPVLRIKEVTTSQSSRYSWTPGGWAFEWVETEDPKTRYRWYTNDFFEVGSCDGDGKSAGSGFTFFRSETYVGQKEPLQQVSLEIIPNPASNLISLKTSSAIRSVEVLNITGTVVLANAHRNALDISTLKAGVYFVKVTTDQGTAVSKFVKR